MLKFLHGFIVGLLLIVGGDSAHSNTGSAATTRQKAEPDFQNSRTLKRIAQSGVIRIGYIPTPGTFAFVDSNGDTVGYSIDICQRAIEQIKKRLNMSDLRVEYRGVKAAERIPLLKSGRIDMECGGNTNTVKRQLDVDFSYTFFNTGVRFLLKRSTPLGGEGAPFWKKKVAVTRGTTAEEVVYRLKAEQLSEPVLVATDAEGLKFVEDGRADAFAQDDVLLYALLATSRQKEELVIYGKFMTVEPYAFMLPKDDPQLREIVDKTMIALIRGGEMEAIYRKWFDTDKLRIPMNIYMRENFRFPNRYGIP